MNISLKNNSITLKLIIIAFLFLLSACQFFKKNDTRKAIARVDNTFLYRDDIANLVPSGTSKEDSMQVVQNYITKWATEQLLVNGAKRNLDANVQLNFENLITKYTNDLYSRAYLDALISHSIDSTITIEEAQKFYEENIDVFKLNEELIKFRYIHIDENMKNYNTVVEDFKRFNKKDRKALDSLSIQFKSYSLNDSIWIRVSQVVNKISAITPENKSKLLKKSNFVQLKDSLGVYLMQISDVLYPKDTAPLEYVRPTIYQIVINKRKLELIKKIETEITRDAITNKEFEIYK